MSWSGSPVPTRPEALTHFRAYAREALAGTVFVGTTSGLSKRLISSLTEFDCRGIRLNLQSAPPPALLDALAENKLDLVITPARIPRKGIDYQAIYSGKVVLVCAPVWRDQLPKSAAPKGIPLIEIQGQAPTLENYWKTVFGIHPDAPALLVPDFQMAVEAAKGGLGLAAVPEGLCSDELQSGQLMIAHQIQKSPEITLYSAQSRGSEAIERVLLVAQLVKRAASTW